MGGCRCWFRSCSVSTDRNHGMHFFHFPVKEEARFKKWVEMSGYTSILKLPACQQRNRVICARHFRDECFMNYKKDRLAGKVIPTLFRLGDGLALDYEQLNAEGKPELVHLEPSKKPYLIPPPEYKCTVGFADCEGEAELKRLLNPIRTENETEELQRRETSDTLNFEGSQMKAKRYLLNIEPLEMRKKPKVLNSTLVFPKKGTNEKSGKNISANDIENSIEAFEIEISDKQIMSCDNDNNKEAFENMEYEEYLAIKTKDVCDKGTQINFDGNLYVRVRQLSNALKNAKAEKEADVHRLKELVKENSELNEQNKSCTEKNIELDHSYVCLERDYKTLLSEQEQIKANLADLKEKYKKLELESHREDRACTSKDSTKSFHQCTISKGHLFNGIKKYLNASMVAFLRMEMFGSVDRQWKPDERRTALDLLRLGGDETAYRYFCDEWRFRLPALGEARKWLTEANIAGDEDEEDL